MLFGLYCMLILGLQGPNAADLEKAFSLVDIREETGAGSIHGC